MHQLRCGYLVEAFVLRLVECVVDHGGDVIHQRADERVIYDSFLILQQIPIHHVFVEREPPQDHPVLHLPPWLPRDGRRHIAQELNHIQVLIVLNPGQGDPEIRLELDRERRIDDGVLFHDSVQGVRLRRIIVPQLDRQKE